MDQAQQVVVRTICNDFFRYRGLAAAPRGLAPGEGVAAFDEDRVTTDMAQFGYVRLDAVRAAPRGRRDWVVVLVLSRNGKCAVHSPELRRLLEGVETERPAKEGRLDEVVVVAEEGFFDKKNLTDVIRETQKRQAGGADEAGAAPFYSAYPYPNFSFAIPEHKSGPRHSVLAPEEALDLLRGQKISLGDLAVILTSDPPIVWNGGREGQVVKVERDSQTAGTAISYRRIVRG